MSLGIPVEEVDPNQVNAAVLHGSKLKEMSAEELDSLLENHQLVLNIFQLRCFEKVSLPW